MTAGEFLLCPKVGEVVVIRPDFERFRVALEVMTESFKGTNDGEEFFVMDVVVELRGLH